MEIDTSIYIVALCIIIALIGGGKIKKATMPLLRIGIVLFLVGGAVAEDAPQAIAAGQQPIIAPPPEQFIEACQTFSDVFSMSDYELFLSNDWWPVPLNNSSMTA